MFYLYDTFILHSTSVNGQLCLNFEVKEDTCTLKLVKFALHGVVPGQRKYKRNDETWPIHLGYIVNSDQYFNLLTYRS